MSVKNKRTVGLFYIGDDDEIAGFNAALVDNEESFNYAVLALKSFLDDDSMAMFNLQPVMLEEKVVEI